jgi:hypothetical protein
MGTIAAEAGVGSTVHQTPQRILDRGRRDGTIRADATTRDIIALPGRCWPSSGRATGARPGTQAAEGILPRRPSSPRSLKEHSRETKPRSVRDEDLDFTERTRGSFAPAEP